MATKKILLISTGGTIAGNISKEKKSEENKISTAEDFNEKVKHTKERIKKMWKINLVIDSKALEDENGKDINIDSSDIIPLHWTLLSNEIKNEYDNYDAFIITHGTNTLGYTSSALSYSLTNINKPVILTGSQVPFGDPGSDALMNLDNCLRVAVWPYNKIKGVIVVFGSSIITGVKAKKNTEFNYDAFKSFTTKNLGEVGRIVNIHEAELKKHNKYYEPIDYDIAVTSEDLVVLENFEPNIASLTEFPGMSPKIFTDLVKHTGVKGFIIRAFGAGDPSTRFTKTFEQLKEAKIPLIVTTQAPNGNANFQVNESGRLLKKENLATPAYNMSMESQVTKLSWLLGQNLSYDEINTKFSADIKGEIELMRERKQ